LANCIRGCPTEGVLAALGLTMADLFPPRRGMQTTDGAAAQSIYRICDLDGNLVAEHLRQDGPGGKRMWWRRNGKNSLGGLSVCDLPLYRCEELKHLPPGARVVLCEGEKPADALRSVGVAALGTVTGANACPGAEALKPLLGLDVLLWPDGDRPGVSHMEAVGRRLVALGGRPRRVRWPEAPPGGDAADFVASLAEEGWGDDRRERVEALLASAEEWKLEGEAAAGLRLVEVRDFLADETPLPAPVIENIGLAGTLTLLFGPPESGKSWLGMEAARCVTSGRPFLGRFACTKGPALLVEQESAPALLRARLAELEKGDPRPQDAAPLMLLPLQDLVLDSPEAQAEFREAAMKIRPRLLAIDTAISVSGATDFLHAGQVRAWLQWFRHLAADLQALIILIAHSPKWASKEPQLAALYGSVDFGASADVALATVALDGGENFRLCCVKNRWGTERPDLTFSIAPGEQGGLTLAATSSAVGLGRLILDALDSEEWTQGGELDRLVTEAGFSDRARRKAVKVLMKRGLVERQQDPANRSRAMFRLRQEGVE
jgi:hypothetical protein